MAWHVACVVVRGNAADWVFARGKPEGMRLHRRHRYRWQGGSIDVTEVGCEGTDWIRLT